MYGEINTGAEAASLVQTARTVHKFSIPVDGDWHRQDLPQGANLVHVGNTMLDKNREYLSDADHALHFWAEVPASPGYKMHREFRVFGTGDTILEVSAQWVGTFIEDGLVWHMYMRPGA